MIVVPFARRFPVSGRRFGQLLIVLFIGTVVASPAQASFQFATWGETQSSPTVSWSYSSGTATLTGSVPVSFNFDNIATLPSTPQPATLTITASTDIAGTVLGPLITEPLSGSISITSGTGANLLTIGFTGSITGSGTNATVAADVTTPGDAVTFSSDFLNFPDNSGNSFELILVTNTALSLNSDNFLSDFTATVPGHSASVLNSNSVDPVPEPASLVSVCSGLIATSFVVMIRRRRKPR